MCFFTKLDKIPIIFMSCVGAKDKQYALTRRAPPPPKCLSEGIERKSSNLYILDKSSNIVSVSVDSCLSDTYKHLESIINTLIDKEKQYIFELKEIIKQLQVVSTHSCNNKLQLIRSIFNFHTKILLKLLRKCSNPIDIANLFVRYRHHLGSYCVFAENKNDFSYLVMDVCEKVIDHFKSRLLEYNFTLSQIKTVFKDDVKMKVICDEAEEVIKNIYQRINIALVFTNICDE